MGLYDYLMAYNMSYDNFMLRLGNIAKFLPIKYSDLVKQCDELYDENEYKRFLIENKKNHFENLCSDCWEAAQTVNDDTENAYSKMYDKFCDLIDENLKDLYKDCNTYIRVLWYVDDKDPEELTEELLDLGKRFKIRQYCVFKDSGDNTIVVALHEKFDIDKYKGELKVAENA